MYYKLLYYLRMRLDSLRDWVTIRVMRLRRAKKGLRQTRCSTRLAETRWKKPVTSRGLASWALGPNSSSSEDDWGLVLPFSIIRICLRRLETRSPMDSIAQESAREERRRSGTLNEVDCVGFGSGVSVISVIFNGLQARFLAEN